MGKNIEQLKKQIRQYACQIVERDENEIDDNVLSLILSDSVIALEFVCLLEDEFEIEFDDDEIDLDFFSNFTNISQLVEKHLVG
ncbi:MAG: phosphopantetheine-binding protein [Rikenellaceae bacterium]|nr:phosphopantetheine-binding protein [Rikenellaceae bacterium]